MKKSTWLIVGGIVFALAVFGCVVCLVMGGVALLGDEDGPVSELTPVFRQEYPTFTPTPTDAQPPAEAVVPANTPTPGTSPLEILSHHSYEENGLFHIVGEVRNNSVEPMESVQVVATLYDDANSIVGKGFAYTLLEVIPSDGKSPFETITGEYAGVTHYDLEAQGNPGSLPRQDVVVAGHRHYEEGGLLFVGGEVQNTGDSSAEFVEVIITLYDAAGNVVGTGFTYTFIETIPPGGKSPFETAIGHYPGFDHYEISIQGN